MASRKVDDAHKKAVRDLRLANKRAAKQRIEDARSIATLGVNGEDFLTFCSYCGATNALRHTHHTNRCVECGKLYDRWRKARRLGDDAELRRLKPVLLQRIEHARCVDKAATQRIDGFYQQVKETEVMDDKRVVRHKICKQCGRCLPMEDYRKYTPRGTGAYKTTQGYYTICKACESISNRAAAALRTGNQATIDKLRDYYKELDAKGLPPVTAAAKRVLGIDPARQARADGLDDLLAATLGKADSGVDEFCNKLRRRDFASADEAYEQLKALRPELKEAGVYDEMNELVEAWFDEDD